MKKLAFLLAFCSLQTFAQDHMSRIKITHIEPECTFFNDSSPSSLLDKINQDGSSLRIIVKDYKPKHAREFGVNKFVRIHLSLGSFLGGIPLKYDHRSNKHIYDRNEEDIVSKDNDFSSPWGHYNEYSLDLIHNTISLAKVSFDKERMEARSGSCRLHFIEESALDAYHLKKAAIYHRLHSKE